MASLGRSRFIKTRGVIYDPPATEFDVKTIVSLDQSDIEIEYHHTRKILC